jgi:hypothetical protein
MLGEGKNVDRKMTMPMAQRRQLFEHGDSSETPQQHLDLWWSSHLCDSANMNNILWLKWSNMLGDEIFFSRDQTSHITRLKYEVRGQQKQSGRLLFSYSFRRPQLFPILVGHNILLKQGSVCFQ